MPAALRLVVGIGASAGGLESLEKLFAAMPESTGSAFVVVQHLSPDFKSMMDELLARRTKIRIQVAADGMPVEPDTIYLMPARKEMIVAQGKLLLTDKDPDRELTLPIDGFFRSLANEYQSRAVAVVLSGTGSDGSRGIRDVKQAGGLVISESERSAKFSGMPASAIDTGVVDLVLDAESIPRRSSTTPTASRPGKAPRRERSHPSS
jgi:two-component system CheB/CheR fusion protein